MKRKQSLFTILVALLIALSVLAGCSGSSPVATTPPPPSLSPAAANPSAVNPSTQTTAPSSTPAQTSSPVVPQTSITVTDMAGRKVTLPAQIKTIATFGSIGVLNAIVEVMGEGSKILNQMSASFTKTDQWKYQYVFAPQIKSGPLFENAAREIDIEAVLKASPDLCLCMFKEAVATLEAKGLTVIYLEWQDSADVETCITLLGEIFNKPDVAKDYLNYFDDMVAKAGKLTAGIAEKDKKKVLYGNITTFTQPHAIAEWWIEAAGGISVTNDGHDLEKVSSYVYTLEDLLKWNPDVMVTTSASMSDELKKDSRLSKVTAIVNNKIYKIPTVAHVWGNRTPEQPLTVMWMMNKLYPDIMNYDMLAKEISYYYSHFYQTKLTDAQISEIIGK